MRLKRSAEWDCEAEGSSAGPGVRLKRAVQSGTEAEGRSAGPGVRLKREVQGGTVRLKGEVQVQV